MSKKEGWIVCAGCLETMTGRIEWSIDGFPDPRSNLVIAFIKHHMGTEMNSGHCLGEVYFDTLKLMWDLEHDRDNFTQRDGFVTVNRNGYQTGFIED